MYGGTKTEMQRLLADAQKITGVKYDINNLSDVYSAIHVIQGELGITGTTANEAATTLSGSFSMMKASFTDLMGNLALGQNVGQSLQNVVTSAGTFLANLIPMVVNIVVSIPQAIIGALPSIIPTIRNCGQQIMQSLTGGVSMSMPELLQKGVDAITGFANTFLQNIPTALSAMGNVLSAILARIMQALPQILDAGITLIGNLARGLINNLPAIYGAMANVIVSLMKTLYENYPTMIQRGLELIGKLVGGLIRAIPEIVGAMPQIIGAIVNSFASVDWIDLGKNIILGIVRGIAGAAGEIAKALGDICKNALNSAKKSLGIHSPSRVFRDEVGKYIPEGMAVGISANTSDVTEAIDDMKTQAVAASKMEISSRYTSTAQKNYDDKVDAILGLLAEYLPDCAEPTVIDGNSLVDGINTQLGLAVV